MRCMQSKLSRLRRCKLRLTAMLAQSFLLAELTAVYCKPVSIATGLLTIDLQQARLCLLVHPAPCVLSGPDLDVSLHFRTGQAMTLFGVQQKPAQSRGEHTTQAALTASRAAATAARKSERQHAERAAALQAALSDSKNAERAAQGRAAGMLDAMRRAQCDKQVAVRDAEAAKERASAHRRALKTVQAKAASLEESLAKVWHVCLAALVDAQGNTWRSPAPLCMDCRKVRGVTDK